MNYLRTLLAVTVLLVFSSCGKGQDNLDTPTKDQYFSDGQGVDLLGVDVYEKFVALGVPAKPLKQAMLYLQENSDQVDNQDYMTLIDFAKHSGETRMFLLDMVSVEVERLHVAHGKNTDPSHTGFAKYFSNVNNSKKSSLGIYLASERYYGKNGLSLRLDGKEATNSNARRRAIVVHGAKYVSTGNSKQGRSWGCPAVSNSKIKSVVDRIEDGSIFYVYN